MDPQPVLIDVYPWLKQIELRGFVPMEGVFRHAEALCRLYYPAVTYSATDTPFKSLTMDLLGEYLGKSVFVLRENEHPIDAQFEMLGTKWWVSLAVDAPSPWLDRKTNVKKLAILHDSLSLEGVFGEFQKQQFIKGALSNDVFAYVSTTALHDFCKHLPQLKRSTPFEFVKYGCFHEFDADPLSASVLTPRSSDRTISVSSIFPRKNIARAREITKALGLRHYHVGHRREMDETEFARLAIEEEVNFLGELSESTLRKVYRASQCFVCASFQEGFSMPAMEAILLGVPNILLSDIMAHREIYGSYAVNFFNPKSPVQHVKADSPFLYSVTEENRKEIFLRFSKETVMRPLRNLLEDKPEIEVPFPKI